MRHETRAVQRRDTESLDGQRGAAPGKQARTDGLGSATVQRKASGEANAAAGGERAADWDMSDGMMAAMGIDVSATADRGVAGASSQLPHLDAIQRSFGRHDVSHVRSAVGGDAAHASAELGAHAYATGDRVAFAQQPDLHTAAHEAAHVVQQAGGVHLKDGLGQAGDLYEQNADAVADAVVAGRSAEGLLDGFASYSARGEAAVQAKAVQRVAADYKDAAHLKGLSLGAFDAYVHSQADWANSPALNTNATAKSDKEKLRALLGLARRDDNMILNVCGAFGVTAMLDLGIGQGSSADLWLREYCRATTDGKNTGTVNIHATSRAPNISTALKWGDALLKLVAGIGAPIVANTITQNDAIPGLQWLVHFDKVGDLINYVKTYKPLLDASNGMDIRSFILFAREGGTAKLASYKSELPEIRNYHRFSMAQLDALVVNKAAAKTNKTNVAPLPICAVVQSPYDHSGAFHRDDKLTPVITRVTHLTLVVEGKGSLADCSQELARFAAYGEGDKLDEVMVNGHGETKQMELAGDRTVSGDQYSRRGQSPLTVDAQHHESYRGLADQFIASLAVVLRDDPDSRVVLNACLTNSNGVNVELSDDPDEAATQIKAAIRDNPSLATGMKRKMGAHQAQVRGANASCGTVDLLDGPGGNSGSIDLASTTDPQLTAIDKLDYAKFGVEPTGVLRAILEAWANARGPTITALEDRVARKDADTSWNEKVITSLIKLIIAAPTNAEQIRTFADVAGALAHMKALDACSVKKLKEAKVPDAHLNAIFTNLATSAPWASADTNYIPMVFFQVWMEKNAGKVGDFHAFLDASNFTTATASRLADFSILTPLAAQLVPTPGDPTAPPRGTFLLALLFLQRLAKAAPKPAIDYIKAVVGRDNQAFPDTCGVDALLVGATKQTVLTSAGVIPDPVAQPDGRDEDEDGGGDDAQPAHNLAPTAAGDNTIAVASVTKKCRTYGMRATNVYMLPDGNKLGTVASGTQLHIIGTVTGPQQSPVGTWDNVPFYAVEHTIGTDKVVFVPQCDVQLV